MKATELLALLREFHRDKLTMRQRHVAAARHVPNYDFNNTYQYVICREDVQLNWLSDAITGHGRRTRAAARAGDAVIEGGVGTGGLLTQDRTRHRRSSTSGGRALNRCRTPVIAACSAS